MWHASSDCGNPGLHGKNFEKDVSELAFKRLLNDARLEDFLFTREKRGAGKFDDIVILRKEVGKEEGLILAQLKHKKNHDASISYGHLAEDQESYFFLPKYYEYFLDSRKSIHSDPVLSQAKLKTLYMCTNVSLEENLGKIMKEKIGDDCLFKRNESDLVRLRVPNDLKQIIFAKSYATTRYRLSQELVCSLMAETQIDIASMIKDEKASLIKDYHKALVDYVIDSQTKGLKNEFWEAPGESEAGKLLECILEALFEFHTNFESLNIEDLQRKLNVKPDVAQNIRERLKIYHNTENKKSFLQGLKFTLKQNFWKIPTNSHETLPGDEFIDVDKINRDIDEFLALLIFATNLRSVKSILEREMNLELYTRFSAKFGEWFEEGTRWDKNERCWYRKWLSRREIIAAALETTVVFQGNEINVQHLIGNASNLLTPDFIIQAFSCVKIYIGLPPVKDSEAFFYYIPRKILFRENEKKVYNEKDLIRESLLSEKRIFLLVGEPGLGKSTFLESVVRTMHKNNLKCEPTWIIKIPLIAFKKELKLLNSESLEDIIAFLAKMENCRREFDQNLLKIFITRKGSVNIYFDGLDEVEDLQAKVIKLIKFLKANTLISQIWLTSRTHLQTSLENSLNESAITLEKMNKEDQISMLVHYWKHTTSEKDTVKLTDFANQLVEKINDDISFLWQEFLGIPLQTFMVGFVCQEEVEVQNPKVPDILTFATLYSKFIDQKYEEYFHKFGLEQMDDYWKETFKRDRTESHQHLALNYWSKHDNFKKLFLFSENDKYILLKIGLVFEKENRIYFIHHTFAEYFYADLCAEVKKSNHNCKINCEDFLIKMTPMYTHLPTRNPDFVNIMFDLKIAEDFRPHYLAMKGEKEELKKLGEEELNSRDYIGRSLMYYAIRYVQFGSLDLITKKNICLDNNDVWFLFQENVYVDILESPMWSVEEWDARGCVRLAVNLKFYLFALEKSEDIMRELNRHQDIDKSKLVASLEGRISRTKEIYRKLCSDSSELDLQSLPNKIYNLQNKKLLLIEAHRYFEENIRHFIGFDEEKLTSTFKTSEFQRCAQTVSGSRRSAYKITYDLYDFYVWSFRNDKKLPSILLTELNFNNLFLILRELDAWQIPVFIPYPKELNMRITFKPDFGGWVPKSLKEMISPEIYSEISFEMNPYAKMPFKRLTEMITQQKIIGREAEVIEDIWKLLQKYEFDDLMEKPYFEASEKVIMHILKKTLFGQLIDLHERFLVAIAKQDQLEMSVVMEQAKRLGWWGMIRNAHYNLLELEKNYFLSEGKKILSNSFVDFLREVNVDSIIEEDEERENE